MLYLDTSLIVAVLSNEAMTARAWSTAVREDRNEDVRHLGRNPPPQFTLNICPKRPARSARKVVLMGGFAFTWASRRL